MKKFEMMFYSIVIVFFNIRLIWGKIFESMIFIPEKFCEGQWWRILTHPFVHVSWYHLLLDAIAFYLLLSQLKETSLLKRSIYIFICGIGALSGALIALPGLNSIGYCGLSGLDHGLMVICSLEMINSSTNGSLKQAGILCLILVSLKCMIEAYYGKMVFSFFHFNLIGSPVALSHTGGFTGGLVAFFSFRILSYRQYLSAAFRGNFIRKRRCEKISEI